MPRWAPDAALRLEQAAIELFAEKGFAGATVPEIAQRAGLTTRTFFRHFADKRDVLFLRERELPAVVAELLATAPPGLDPLALAMHGLESAATGDLERWKDDIRTRRAIVESEPQLRERERLKSAVLTDAIRDGLRAGGVDADGAALTAAVASALFDAALERWLGGDDGLPLVEVLARLRARLGRLASVPVAGGGAEDEGVLR
ncbi:TetR/AcrR family transcriptional regulator [Cnuibacter physcomitrellae]|uniref:TetR/AcrR family transcriptional regulator n=1 Tax=Cnuibacter physcomitrellae TaxID=1619308 RepID=UPI002175B99A|nr:TetR/AcrR family transcriptional regulator [Cnuibacter physcomitrellae]MCS5497106.1 TetR/AcrR family transcriptional regulator [Cnuibacter physcomitrellae]